MDILDHRVVIPSDTDRLGVSNLIDDFDRASGVLEDKSSPVQDMSVGFRVQVGKSFAELEFAAVDGDGTIRTVSFFPYRLGDIVEIEA